MDTLILQKTLFIKNVILDDRTVLLVNEQEHFFLPVDLLEFEFSLNTKVLYSVRERPDRTRYFEVTKA